MAIMMRLTVLIALNLAVLPRVPVRVLATPSGLFTLAILNIVLVQSLVFDRPLQTFHYAFLIVGTCCSIMMTFLIDSWDYQMTSLGIVSATFLWWREIGVDDRLSFMLRDPEFISKAEMWVTSALTILPAWGAGWAASVLVRRRGIRSGAPGRGVIAFFKGALIGFGFYSLWTSIRFSVGVSPGFSIHRHFPYTNTPEWYKHWLSLALAAIFCGTAGWYMSWVRRARSSSTTNGAGRYRTIVNPPVHTPEERN
jgi:hypothetical protein